MRKGLLLFTCILMIVVLSGCGGEQSSSNNNNQEGLQTAATGETNKNTSNQSNDSTPTNSNKTPPVIDHLDTYPFPVPSGWKEEKFEVSEYDDGKSWEAIFTFEGDELDQATAYREVIEDLGYEIQSVLNDVFKIGMAEFAGVPYHGTFSFEVGDEYSEWGDGQRYVEITFFEKK